MSVLIRLDTGLTKYKVRMFEQGSRRQDCCLCQQRQFGILLRFVDPFKCERLICHQCIAKLAIGNGPALPEPAPKQQIITEEERSLKIKEDQRHENRMRNLEKAREAAARKKAERLANQDKPAEVLS